MSVLSLIRKLHVDSRYTINIAAYTPGKQMSSIKTFSGKYIGWKLKGLESLDIANYPELWHFAALPNDNCASESDEHIVDKAYMDNIIGLDTICLLFEDILVISKFDPKTQKFMGGNDIAPFKVSKIENRRNGTTAYESYVQMCYISGSGSEAVMNITQNDCLLEVELVESDA